VGKTLSNLGEKNYKNHRTQNEDNTKICTPKNDSKYFFPKNAFFNPGTVHKIKPEWCISIKTST
jgi:hypothetical protein